MNKKAQSTVVGFTMITLIILTVAGTTFLWARPLIEKTNNLNEVERLENKMNELNKAIIEVASERSQRSVEFEIKKGTLRYTTNNTMKFEGFFTLPSGKRSNNTVLYGNGTNSGPCINDSAFGRLGYDEPGCLLERGSITLELKYPILNDSLTNKCYGILLGKGRNLAAGKGSHSILLTFNGTSTHNTVGCDSTTKQIVKIDID